MRTPTVLLLTLCGLLAGGVTPARAASFTVSVDTSALAGLGTVELDVQLFDGDQVRNTQVVLRDFVFGAVQANPWPAATLVGDASGSMDSTVALRDGDFFNRFAQAFTPGGALSFVIDVLGSSNPTSPASFADSFSIALLLNGLEVDTEGPLEELISLSLVEAAVPEAYGFQVCRDDDCTNVPAPTVTAVPEPATALLVLTGAALIGVRRRSPSRARPTENDSRSR